MALTRKKFLFSMLGAGLSSAAYGRFVESQWLEVNQEQIPLSLSRKVRLLHLSDLHASETVSYEFLDEAIELGISYKPDLICITGDFITTLIPEPATYSRILQKLSAVAPAYASFGNHDGGAWAVRKGGYSSNEPVNRLLKDSGIIPLWNEQVQLQCRKQTLRLVGLGDLWASELLPKASLFGEVADTTPTIVLSHNPDTKDHLLRYPWELLLAGHTHGGQIRLPFVGSPIVPVRDRRYIEGLHNWQNRWLHVSRGIGNLYGLRINCRPQVSLLELG